MLSTLGEQMCIVRVPLVFTTVYRAFVFNYGFTYTYNYFFLLPFKAALPLTYMTY